MSHIDLITIGASTGGIKALEYILSRLPEDFATPIVIIQHMHKDADALLVNHLKSICTLKILEAGDKMMLSPQTVYVAPANYHLLLENDLSFSLCLSEKVSFCRPSIDVFFESAAEVYRNHSLAILLSGANSDGTKGATTIKKMGGQVIAQSPDTCEAKTMPKSAIIAGVVDAVLTLDGIITYILEATYANRTAH